MSVSNARKIVKPSSMNALYYVHHFDMITSLIQLPLYDGLLPTVLISFIWLAFQKYDISLIRSF
jgi:hypothetical protein